MFHSLRWSNVRPKCILNNDDERYYFHLFELIFERSSQILLSVNWISLRSNAFSTMVVTFKIFIYTLMFYKNLFHFTGVSLIFVFLSVENNMKENVCFRFFTFYTYHKCEPYIIIINMCTYFTV